MPLAAPPPTAAAAVPRARLQASKPAQGCHRNARQKFPRPPALCKTSKWLRSCRTHRSRGRVRPHASPANLLLLPPTSTRSRYAHGSATANNDPTEPALHRRPHEYVNPFRLAPKPRHCNTSSLHSAAESKTPPSTYQTTTHHVVATRRTHITTAGAVPEGLAWRPRCQCTQECRNRSSSPHACTW